jgi:cell division septum initiation protein DivIVA
MSETIIDSASARRVMDEALDESMDQVTEFIGQLEFERDEALEEVEDMKEEIAELKEMLESVANTTLITRLEKLGNIVTAMIVELQDAELAKTL